MGIGLTLLPGVRVSASRRGVRAGIGPRIARVHVGAGRTGFSSGLGPVTLWTEGPGARRVGGSGGSAARGLPPGYGRAEPPPQVRPAPIEPVPEHERLFAEGVEAYRADRDAQARILFIRASERDTGDATTADELFAGITSWVLGDADQAIEYLEKAVAATGADKADRLIQKYASDQWLNIPLTAYYTAQIPIGTLAGAVALAEIYQDADRVDEAITVVERFAFRAEQEGRVDFLVSLCELYLHAERWDDALGICGRFQNFSDASSYTMVMVFFKGRALAGKGLLEPAVEVYKDSLRFRSDRNQMLLASIRLGRALALRDLGRNAPARKDLNRIIADIPDFPLVQEILAEMES